MKSISKVLRLRISSARGPTAQCFINPVLHKTFTTSPRPSAKNRIHPPIRSESDFSSFLSLSSTARTPLLTLWTASWCSSCRAVSPFLQDLIEHEGLGEREGAVVYAEVELDAPDIVRSGLATQYFINSIPTLLSFRAGEAALESKITSVDKMKDREFVRLWVENEARRGGDRGGEGGIGFSLKGLFGTGDR
ncbi:MAG: hypothetical protein Q9219_003232 [cf. Caloplaca sp. 3 TL-2023]